MYKILLTIGLLTLCLSSCDKEDQLPFLQPVLFQFEYVNHAWGYTHEGWMINGSGEIKGFKLPETWNNPDKDMLISKDELFENLDQSDKLYGKVNSSDLVRHYNHRKEFREGERDTSDTFMADAGVGALYALVWDSDVKKYEKVLLASKGDISVTNTKSEAKSAVRWLKSVGKQTDRFSWFD